MSPVTAWTGPHSGLAAEEVLSPKLLRVRLTTSVPSFGRTQLSDTGVSDELTVVSQVTCGVAGQGPVDESRWWWCALTYFNPLMGTLKPHIIGPLYSNTVIGRLATDGWAVTVDTTRKGRGGLRSRPFAVPNVTAHPSTASLSTLYYSMWHYNYLCTL